MAPQLVSRKLGNLLILRHSKESPADEEWDACLRLMPTTADELSRLRVLVVTDGGGPTVDQRKRLQRMVQGVAVPIAVVSDSIRIRFVASSVALLTSRIRSFTENEFEEALVYLGMQPDERRTAERYLAEMRAAIRGT